MCNKPVSQPVETKWLEMETDENLNSGANCLKQNPIFCSSYPCKIPHCILYIHTQNKKILP